MFLINSKPDPKRIRWILTVPAIWSEESKRFMREVAFKVHIYNKKTAFGQINHSISLINIKFASVFVKSLLDVFDHDYCIVCSK